MRARTRSELAAAMAKRNVPQEAADEVLARFSEVGLINDGDFARSWVASRARSKQLAPSRLRQELRGKGVGAEEIAEALTFVSKDDEREAALAFARKRARVLVGLDRQAQYRRLAGALGRRGYGPGIVTGVVSEVLGELADAGAAGDDFTPADLLVDELPRELD